MKTKVFFFVVALISVVIFYSCESKSGKRQRVVSVQSKVEAEKKVEDSLVFEIQKLKRQNEEMERFISYLKEDPELFLLILDAELEKIKKGEDTFGSFSDFFVPTIDDALKAGASIVAIRQRVNGLLDLAEDGLFLSTFEEDLYKKGGRRAILEYIGIE